MSIREDFKEYADSDGMLTPNFHPPVNSTGNGLLYTAEEMITLHELKLLTLEDQRAWDEIVKSCLVDGGMLKRNKYKNNEQNSHDDYTGVLTACYLLDSDFFTRNIYQYGKEHWWNFNNVNPGKFTGASWLGRFPALIAHMYWCAGKTPNLFLRLYTALATIVSSSSDRKNHDNWMLTYLRILVNNDKCWINRLANKVFMKKLFQHYPDGFRQIFKEYCVNPQHPLAKHFVTRNF